MRLIQEGSPGTIVLVTSDLGRYGAFEQSLENLLVPNGTKLLRIRGMSSAKSQNIGVHNRVGEWVWFIDDDHTFAPDILMRLLKHNVDVVAPLVPMRFPPYSLVLYRQLEMAPFIEDYYKIEDLADITGLMKVDGLPKAGCLIRENVWKDIPEPWFKIGKIHVDDIEDDKYFMWELRVGYKYDLWCDTDQTMGHISTFAVGIKDRKISITVA